MRWGLGIEHEVSLFTARVQLTGAQIKRAFALKPQDGWFENLAGGVHGNMVYSPVKRLDSKGAYTALVKLPDEAVEAVVEAKEGKPWGPAVDTDWSDTGTYFEFITQDFRNATVASVMAQLHAAERGVTAHLAKAGTPVFMWPYGGWPFVLTELPPHFQPSKGQPVPERPQNVVRVGGKDMVVARDYTGSYHVNVTLPVRRRDFWVRHHAAMKALQWLEPLFVAAWGQPDVFSYGDEYQFSEGSFRMMANTHSRMGTVDLRGASEDALKRARERTANWQEPAHAPFVQRRADATPPPDYLVQSTAAMEAYMAESRVGADFRRGQPEPFGFEFRILDHFPPQYLPDVLHIILLACDQSAGLDPQRMPDARTHHEWNEMARAVMMEGWNAAVPRSAALAVWQALGLGDLPARRFDTALALFRGVVDALWRAHGGGKGRYTRYMVDAAQRRTKPRVVNLNKRAFEAYARALRMAAGGEDAAEAVPVHRPRKSRRR
jgi:hypothetical protein